MIVVDLEFSGLDPETNSIISLGAVDFHNPKNTIYLECKPRTGSEWNEQAETAHGLSQEYLKKIHTTEKQLLEQFFAWAEKIPQRTLAGQSLAWDVLFLWKGALRYDLVWPFMNKMLELHTVSFMHHEQHHLHVPQKNGINDLGLDDNAAYAGLPRRPKGDFHNALYDAKITAECFSRLLYNKKLLPEFDAFPIPDWKPEPVKKHFSKDK
jgi:DNA polymerase-3 subunit epsilon